MQIKSLSVPIYNKQNNIKFNREKEYNSNFNYPIGDKISFLGKCNANQVLILAADCLPYGKSGGMAMV